MRNLYVLIHSPLVGPLTWSRVAEEMRRRGLDVLVPTLMDSPDSKDHYWKQHAESVSQALAGVPQKTTVTLVAHSGAGPLLPAVRRSILNPVHAYVFVDAGIPHDGASRLDLMRSEDSEWAARFEQELDQGGQFPNWSFEDLQEVLPDETLRRQMVEEIHPRERSFFVEPLPVFEGWPDAPCVYIQFSNAYNKPAAQARAAGWITRQLEAGHFHMLVDPGAVVNEILSAINKIG